MGATGGLLESSVVDVVVVVDPHENKRPTVDWSVLPMFIVVFVFFFFFFLDENVRGLCVVVGEGGGGGDCPANRGSGRREKFAEGRGKCSPKVSPRNGEEER